MSKSDRRETETPTCMKKRIQEVGEKQYLKKAWLEIFKI